MFGKKGNGPRGVNFIWPLAGGYLVYLGGDLLWTCYRGESSNAVLCIIAGIVFMVFGGLVILREWHIYRNGPQQEELPEAEETAKEPDDSLPEETEEET